MEEIIMEEIITLIAFIVIWSGFLLWTMQSAWGDWTYIIFMAATTGLLSVILVLFWYIVIPFLIVIIGTYFIHRYIGNHK